MIKSFPKLRENELYDKIYKQEKTMMTLKKQ